MRLALALIALLSLAGTGSIVLGIYLLAGSAWALVASGIASLAAAAFLRSGITSNG
jgi:hypothetical protein